MDGKMLGNWLKVISLHFNFLKISYWRFISSKGISCLLYEFGMKSLTSTADPLPSFLPRVLLNPCTFRGTPQPIAHKDFPACCSSAKSCLSTTLPSGQCHPCTLPLLILSCRWAHVCHTVPGPWLQHRLCWHPKWRIGFLFFTAWAEPLIPSIFTSAFPVQDIAEKIWV